MHTIRYQHGKWRVIFVEAHAEAGYNPHAHIIATCKNSHWAALACSFLNGGECPTYADGDDIYWETV